MTNARLNSISNALNTHEDPYRGLATPPISKVSSRIGRDNLNALLSVLLECNEKKELIERIFVTIVEP